MDNFNPQKRGLTLKLLEFEEYEVAQTKSSQVTLSIVYKFMNNQLIDVPISWLELSKDYKCTNSHINKEAQGERKIINLIDFLLYGWVESLSQTSLSISILMFIFVCNWNWAPQI